MIAPKLLAELDEMYAKVPHGVWHIFQTKWPYHFEIGPSERQMCAIMTNDSTPENEFGEANARMLSHVMTHWQEIRAALASARPEEKGAVRVPTHLTMSREVADIVNGMVDKKFKDFSQRELDVLLGFCAVHAAYTTLSAPLSPQGAHSRNC